MKVLLAPDNIYYQVMQDTTTQLRENDVQVGIDEYVKQLNEFLPNK